MKKILLLACLIMTQAFAAERAIDQEVVVAAKADAVYRAWTTTEGIKTFFAPDARVELAVDGPFEIYINPYAPAGLKGADNMRVIGFQQDKMLSFTWNAPPSLPEARKQRTIVILRFQAEGDKTRVHLHHVGWGEGGEWDKAYEYFSNAWPRVMANLQRRFAEGPVDWTQWLQQMKKLSGG